MHREAQHGRMPADNRSDPEVLPGRQGGCMMLHTCPCGMLYLVPAPDRWIEKHPELKGKCPDCIAERLHELGEVVE